MDLTDLVHSTALTVLRSPALHFAIIGIVAFVALSDGRPSASPNSERIEIPWARAAQVHGHLAKERGRPLNDVEVMEANQLIVDREVLYLYSQEIGLQNDPVVQQRLAQIAKFVSETPSEHATVQDGAREAIEFGLMDGDPVVRRIMIDGARRLIRATALVREPDDAGLQLYLDQHQDEYQTRRQTRITHVVLNRTKRGDRTKAAAMRMRNRLIEQNITPEDAAGLGDPSVIPPSLPLVSDRGLERRLGRDFVIEVSQFPVGSWQGPIRSRLGEHVVFIHERLLPRPSQLEEVREQISSAVRNELADKVLRARLDELQHRYQIYVQDPPS